MYRTDMAIELLDGKNTGCAVNTDGGKGGIKRTDVEIRTDGAARRLGKPKGFYSTIETNGIFHNDIKAQKAAAEAVLGALSQILNDNIKKKKYTVLVAGLGNSSMTADSLGPRVCRKMIVTRHNKEEPGLDAMQSLCAISPGVLGVTGIETYDILAGLAGRIRPDAVITVDSLSSRAVSRLASAFQVTDSGISPGSGVNNHRFRLDRKSLGVPVIAVGVPLVLYASTIASEVLDEYTAREKGGGKDKSAENERLKNAVIDNVISDILGDLIVTPKDIDMICEDCAHIIALAVNAAVHGLSINAAAGLMQ